MRLLETEAHIFASLLWELGPDRDLVTETEPWADNWVGWRLWTALTALPGVGATTASKLYARKRPRLRPIYDSVVEAAVGNKLWAPLRAELQASPWLHSHLIGLRTRAQLPESISALRVFDVVVWMSAQPSCPLAGRDR